VFSELEDKDFNTAVADVADYQCPGEKTSRWRLTSRFSLRLAISRTGDWNLAWNGC